MGQTFVNGRRYYSGSMPYHDPDDQVGTIISALVLPDAWVDRVLAQVRLVDEVKRVGEERKKTQQQLRRLAQAYVDGHIPDDEIQIDDGTGKPTGRGGAVGAWRDAFIGVGNGVETSLGLVNDTFETAITWDRWPAFDAAVRERVGAALAETFGEHHLLSCRFTHVYPDGPAPYYT